MRPCKNIPPFFHTKAGFPGLFLGLLGFFQIKICIQMYVKGLGSVSNSKFTTSRMRCILLFILKSFHPRIFSMVWVLGIESLQFLTPEKLTRFEDSSNSRCCLGRGQWDCWIREICIKTYTGYVRCQIQCLVQHVCALFHIFGSRGSNISMPTIN